MKLNMPEMPAATLLTALGNYNLLPAIVFMPMRRRCDQAATEAAATRKDPNAVRRETRREFMRSFVAEHPEIRGHRHWDTIIRGAVASHHAGHIPAWKLVIERLMAEGLLDAIFATATVAAGVDFPARTVVLTGADARTANGWRLLTASELQQMTGRAGRRGRDRVGFIVAAPGLHQNPQLIAELLRSPPDPLVSQFRATYSTLLNLLDAFGTFAQVRQIAEKSFAHREAAAWMVRAETERTQSAERLEHRLQASSCGISLAAALAFERLVSARTRLQEVKPRTRVEVLQQWLDSVVQPGRVVGIGRSGRRLVMVTQRRNGNVLGIREDGRPASFPLQRIGRVYAPVYSRREPAIQEAFAEIQKRGKELVIPEPRLHDCQDENLEAVTVFDRLLDSFVAPETSEPERQKCLAALWEGLDDAQKIERATRRIESLRDEVWEPFERRARVLASFGYLDFEKEKVTRRGSWLADLHLERPLVVGEALEKGLFATTDPVTMAAVMAAVSADEERDYGELELSDAIVTSLARFENVGFRVATEEWKYGVEPGPELSFSAAGTSAHWAGGTDWTTLVRETRAEEGDLFRMLSRTGEALLQVAALRKAHTKAAEVAAIAAELVLRDPVR